MSTTVWISPATKAELKILKASLGLKSMDAVLQHLLTLLGAAGAPVEPSGSDESEQGAAREGRKKLVRKPLFSFEKLIDRHEMLEYYTGLDESGVRLLIRRFMEVSRAWCFLHVYRTHVLERVYSLSCHTLTRFVRRSKGLGVEAMRGSARLILRSEFCCSSLGSNANRPSRSWGICMGVGKPPHSDTTRKWWMCSALILCLALCFHDHPMSCSKWPGTKLWINFRICWRFWMPQTGSNRNRRIFCSIASHTRHTNTRWCSRCY